MQSILEGIARFKRDAFPSRREAFEALGGGQQPKILLVTCSDSRIDPALITQTEPGEVFVVRNAGNLVAAHSAAPSAEAATIEYGLEALAIPDIVVCGHTHCGAMAALAQPGAADGLPSVKAWIETSTASLDRRDAISGFDDDLTKLVAANVCQQLDHLRGHPSVAKALNSGAVRLHGWVYDFERGDIYTCDESGTFSKL
jgi:carbonic anhydrase